LEKAIRTLRSASNSFTLWTLRDWSSTAARVGDGRSLAIWP
jgi:hypothetical protein